MKIEYWRYFLDKKGASGIMVGKFCRFTWSGRCDSLTGCQPSPHLRGGGGKAGKSHLPEAPCQPTEKSQKNFFAQSQ